MILQCGYPSGLGHRDFVDESQTLLPSKLVGLGQSFEKVPGFAPVCEDVCTECQRRYKVESVALAAGARNAFLTEFCRLIRESHDPNQLAGILFDERTQILSRHLDPLICAAWIVQRQSEV